MASSGKKEYTLKINGVEKSIKDFTSLEDAIKKVDSGLNALNENSAKVTVEVNKSAKASKEKAAALSEEEKAAKKLEETQRKTAVAQSEANRAQIEATQALREATREATLQVQAERAAANSVEAMRAELSLLKNEWKGLDIGSEKFKEITVEINTLNDKIKQAEAATGDFRRNVGNYESALGGLNKLSQGIDNTSKSTMGFAQSLLATNQLMSLFGDNSEENTKQAQQLQKILALLSVIQGVNNNLLKNNIVVSGAATIAEKAHVLQVRTKTAALNINTGSTKVNTVAQLAMNAAVKAFPIFFIAAALGTVIGLISSYSDETDGATDSSEKYKSALDGVGFATQEAADAHDDILRQIRDLQIEIDVANGKLTEYQANLLKISNNTADAIETEKNKLTDNLGEIDKKYESFTHKVSTYFKNYFNTDYKAITPWGLADDPKYLEDQLKEREGSIKNSTSTMEGLYTRHYKQLEAETVKHNNREKEENSRAAKSASDTRKSELEKQKSEYIKLLEELRAERIKAEADDEQREIKTIENNKRIRIETIKGNSPEEIELRKLIEENAQKEVKTVRKKYADQRIAAEKESAAELKAIRDSQIADADKRNGLLLSGLDITLEQAKQKIGEVVARDKGGLQLINIEDTRANLQASNKVLDEYIAGVKLAMNVLEASHKTTLNKLKEGTPEYEEELQKYAQANLELNNKLNDANKEREANTKASNEIIGEYFKDLFTKVGGYAEAASMAISSVTETLNMGLEMQIESLNEQLESVTERYEEVTKLREESAGRVEELEQRLRDATGGTAEALKEQLQSEMHSRAELEREEARFAKEKEKREAEIAKKEKQMKRNTLLSNIAQATANTAQAVTQALATIIWPLNLAIASLVGVMGAAQVGLMTKQLTKMEDGGLITGPSHENGGARIQGTNIEVEGGEYVINKDSTAANTRLLNFINNTRSAVSAADLVGVIPNETSTPVFINNGDNNALDYEALAEAMTNVHLSPTVAVTDIIDAQDTVITVRDLAGF